MKILCQRKIFILISTILSLCLLLPGISKPILNISGSIEKVKLKDLGIKLASESMDASQSTIDLIYKTSDFLGVDDNLKGDVLIFQKSNSILDTVEQLFNSGYHIIGILIISFSVIIPTIKVILQSILLFPFKAPLKNSFLYKFSLIISKWSMADVFVIALIISFMALGAANNGGGILKTQSNFGDGFYFFLGYCLLSVLSSTILMFMKDKK